VQATVEQPYDANNEPREYCWLWETKPNTSVTFRLSSLIFHCRFAIWSQSVSCTTYLNINVVTCEIIRHMFLESFQRKQKKAALITYKFNLLQLHGYEHVIYAVAVTQVQCTTQCAHPKP